MRLARSISWRKCFLAQKTAGDDGNGHQQENKPAHCELPSLEATISAPGPGQPWSAGSRPGAGRPLPRSPDLCQRTPSHRARSHGRGSSTTRTQRRTAWWPAVEVIPWPARVPGAGEGNPCGVHAARELLRRVVSQQRPEERRVRAAVSKTKGTSTAWTAPRPGEAQSNSYMYVPAPAWRRRGRRQAVWRGSASTSPSGPRRADHRALASGYRIR